MRLPRKIDHRTRDVSRSDISPIAGNNNCNHIREAATGREISGRLGRIANQIVHPADEHILHPHRPIRFPRLLKRRPDSLRRTAIPPIHRAALHVKPNVPIRSVRPVMPPVVAWPPRHGGRCSSRPARTATAKRACRSNRAATSRSTALTASARSLPAARTAVAAVAAGAATAATAGRRYLLRLATYN